MIQSLSFWAWSRRLPRSFFPAPSGSGKCWSVRTKTLIYILAVNYICMFGKSIKKVVNAFFHKFMCPWWSCVWKIVHYKFPIWSVLLVRLVPGISFSESPQGSKVSVFPEHVLQLETTFYKYIFLRFGSRIEKGMEEKSFLQTILQFERAPIKFLKVIHRAVFRTKCNNLFSLKTFRADSVLHWAGSFDWVFFHCCVLAFSRVKNIIVVSAVEV